MRIYTQGLSSFLCTQLNATEKTIKECLIDSVVCRFKILIHLKAIKTNSILLSGPVYVKRMQMEMHLGCEEDFNPI